MVESYPPIMIRATNIRTRR